MERKLLTQAPTAAETFVRLVEVDGLGEDNALIGSMLSIANTPEGNADAYYMRLVREVMWEYAKMQGRADWMPQYKTVEESEGESI